MSIADETNEVVLENVPSEMDESIELAEGSVLTWEQFNTRSIQERLDRLKARLSAGEDVSEHASDLSSLHGGQDTPWLDAVELLQAAFGLSDFETECLFLSVAVELDLQAAELCSSHARNPMPYPTPALCLSLFENPAWDLLSPERPLKRFLLLDFTKQPTQPVLRSSMVPDQRLVSFVRGLSFLDERLSWYLQPGAKATGDELCAVALSRSQLDEIHLELDRALAARTRKLREVFQITGSSERLNRSAADYCSQSFGLKLRTLAMENLPEAVDELDTLARLWNRERRLSPLALHIDWKDGRSDAVLPRLTNFLARIEGLVIVTGRDPIHVLDGRRIELELPTAEEQQSAWMMSNTLSTLPTIVEQLTGQFDLEIAQIRRVIDLVEGMDACGTNGLAADEQYVHSMASTAWAECRRITRPQLDDLAMRIDCKATWSDLVVPDEQRRLLEQLTHHVRYRNKVLDQWGFRQKLNRGFGVTALFCGESGTGKTMAAEVIAHTLQLDLYRIDLSQVVNKYIGETEKNLRKLFDAAERGGSILFFDEADALFGKRTEVKDSHDRYANVEVNYLLQRLEAFRGLAILATNNRNHLDSAFLRRLRFVVEFPFPEGAERREVWRRAFPDAAPSGFLDTALYSRIGLSGGSIHNIALNAAFAAAAEGEQIHSDHILEAARAELIKTNKSLSVPGLVWPVIEAGKTMHRTPSSDGPHSRNGVTR